METKRACEVKKGKMHTGGGARASPASGADERGRWPVLRLGDPRRASSAGPLFGLG